MKYLNSFIACLWMVMILFLTNSCGVDEEAIKAATAKPSSTPVPAKEEVKDKEPKDNDKTKAKDTPPEAAKSLLRPLLLIMPLHPHQLP